MTTYTQLMNEDQRLYILKSLLDHGGNANDMMLVTSLDAYGYRLSHETLRCHLAWLERYELVRLSKIADLTKAQLTRYGQDVLEGRVIQIGIRKPKAGEFNG